jgi:hypothetical protein
MVKIKVYQQHAIQEQRERVEVQLYPFLASGWIEVGGKCYALVPYTRVEKKPVRNGQNLFPSSGLRTTDRLDRSYPGRRMQCYVRDNAVLVVHTFVSRKEIWCSQ